MISRLRAHRRTFLFAASLLVSANLLFAQSERGAITGEVHDVSGAVVPGARVIITNTTTGVVLEAVSNGSGEYTVPSLQPSVYNVRVEKDGFRPTEEKGLTVAASSTVRADIRLEIGTSTVTVEVQASAAQLQTEDARNSASLSNKLVNDLPLVVGGTVRTPFDLASLSPDAKNLGGDNGFSVGGGQVAAYGTSLDGVSTNTSRALSKSWVASNAPSVEAIDQFTVDTAGYKAEYGHAGGGNLSYASKSGTNQYHGSAYEFLRNNDFDANNWFSNRSGVPISIYKQNDFGFTVGGPVWIPKLYHGKDKTFFFFSYEGFRNRTGANGAVFTIPTPEMYTGDFSKWVTATGAVIPIFDPTTQVTNANGTVTRQQYPGNKIPMSEFSPTALKALGVFQSSGMLKPNTGALPGTAAYVSNNYLETTGTQVYPVNKWSIKIDHTFNEKHRISGYFGDDHEHQTFGADGPPTLPGLYSNYNDLIQMSYVPRLSWDWTITPNKLNHFYAGGNDWTQDHKPPQEYLGSWKNKFCLGNVPNCDANQIQLFYSGTNNPYSAWGGQADNGSENTVYSYNDDFTWIHGNHTLKFGGTYQINHYNGFGRQCEAGCAGFSYQETGVPGGSNPNAGGNSSLRSCWVMRTADRLTHRGLLGSNSITSAASFKTTGASLQSWFLGWVFAGMAIYRQQVLMINGATLDRTRLTQAQEIFLVPCSLQVSALAALDLERWVVFGRVVLDHTRALLTQQTPRPSSEEPMHDRMAPLFRSADPLTTWVLP